MPGHAVSTPRRIDSARSRKNQRLPQASPVRTAVGSEVGGAAIVVVAAGGRVVAGEEAAKGAEEEARATPPAESARCTPPVIVAASRATNEAANRTLRIARASCSPVVWRVVTGVLVLLPGSGRHPPRQTLLGAQRSRAVAARVPVTLKNASAAVVWRLMEREGQPPTPVSDTGAPGHPARGWRRPASRLGSLLSPLAIRDFRLLWLAQVTSELGDWATRLALMLLVYHRTHSAVLSAAVVTASLLPWVGLGQVLTTAVDHLPRRTVMIGADLARALIFGLLVIPVPLAAVFAAAFLSGLFSAPFEAARHAIRVEVTDDDRLGGAITLFLITGQITTMAGFALGGALVTLVGTRATFAVNAASFAASALFVSGIRTRSVGRPTDDRRRGYLNAAFRFVVGDPVLRWCTTLSLTAAFAGMGVEAIAAAYGHGHPADVTLLAVAVPVGIVVASAAVPHSGPARRLLRSAGLVPLLGGAVGVVFFALGPGIVFGVIGFAASGVAVCVPAASGPVVARRMESAFRAPAFSLLAGASLGGQAAGAAVGGVLAGIFGARPTCLAACLALAVVGLAASVRLPDPAVPAAVPAVRRAA